MILQVVFGTFLFLLFINIDELEAASYGFPNTGLNVYKEENDNTHYRILRDLIPRSYNDDDYGPSDEIESNEVLHVNSQNGAMDKFRSVFITSVVAGVGVAVGEAVVKGINSLKRWFG